MPSKEELYTQIDASTKPSYSKGEVKGFIYSVSNERVRSPKTFKKGDVILNGVGMKRRPCVVASVIDKMMYCIPLSTTEDHMNILPHNSRFFEDGWLSNGLWAIHEDYARENFAGVFDDMTSLNKAIKIMKQIVEKL